MANLGNLTSAARAITHQISCCVYVVNLSEVANRPLISSVKPPTRNRVAPARAGLSGYCSESAASGRCKDVVVIARRWTALAEGSEQADAYCEHFADAVRPQLESIDGFLGATLERVDVDRGVEIVVVTRWQSLAAIRGFTGADTDRAVVEPEARALLSRFDDRVRHVELADGQVFGHLEVIDVPAEAAAHEPWFNETLTSVNDAVIRLGVIDGDFHWHKHDNEDEFFLVLEGELLIDIEGADTITLTPHQACSVPKGVVHRTRATRRTTIVMVEAAGVVPTGD